MKNPIDNSIPAQIARHEHELDKIDGLHGECCLALARDPDNADLKAEVRSLEAEKAERLAHIDRLRKAGVVEARTNSREVRLAALKLQQQRVPTVEALAARLVDAQAKIEDGIALVGPHLAEMQALLQELASVTSAAMRAGGGAKWYDRYATQTRAVTTCDYALGANIAHALASAGFGRGAGLNQYVAISAPAKPGDVTAAVRKAVQGITDTIKGFIERDAKELGNG